MLERWGEQRSGSLFQETWKYKGYKEAIADDLSCVSRTMGYFPKNPGSQKLPVTSLSGSKTDVNFLPTAGSRFLLTVFPVYREFLSLIESNMELLGERHSVRYLSSSLSPEKQRKMAVMPN